MSVVKAKRNEGQLFVFDKTRQLMSALLKDLQMILAEFRESHSEMSNIELRLLDREIEFLQQDAHLLMSNILHANFIFPTNQNEIGERRSFQNTAVSYVHSLQNDIVSIVDLYPLSMKKLLHHANDISQIEILLKKWRKNNIKILKHNTETACKSQNPGYFCNVNNNGNSNNNNANNTNNGVRFDLIQNHP